MSLRKALMPDDLRGISLTALQSYLSRSAWELLDEDDRTSMWQTIRDGKDYRVVLPSSTEIADHTDLIIEAIRTIAYVERRTPSEVLADMRIPGGSDSVSVRLVPDAPAGQAPLSLAYDLVGALKRYVVGSAAALEIPGLVLPNRRPARAENFATQTRLSTAPGSFIAHLFIPIFDDEDRGRDEPVDDEGRGREAPTQPALVSFPLSAYGRQVAHRMRSTANRAVELAKTVGNGDETVSAFGVPQAGAPNATELEALAALGGENRMRYQLRFAESPLIKSSAEPAVVPVTHAEQLILGEAADFLRSKQPRPDVTVVGLVVRLHREGKFGPGDIVVQGIGDDSDIQRRFQMHLSEEDYNAAVLAHSEGYRVMAAGDLEIAGTRRSLRPLRSFSIVPGLET